MTTIFFIGESNDSPKLTERSQMKTKYERKFKVLSTDKDNGPDEASNCAGIPPRWSFYAFGSSGSILCRCTNITATCVGRGPQGDVWEVTCIFETPDKTEDQEQHSDPLLEPFDASMTSQSKTIPMLGYTDPIDGEFKGWTTSAGEVYEKVPDLDESRTRLSLTGNYELDFPVLDLRNQFVNTTNRRFWWNQLPHFWRCTDIRGVGCTTKLEDDSMFDYLRVTYEFELANIESPTGFLAWDVQLLDKGTWYWLKNDDGTFKYVDGKRVRQRFLTPQAHPYTGLLDGSGGKLDDNTPPVVPVYLPIRSRYPDEDWDALALPQSFSECRLMLR